MMKNNILSLISDNCYGCGICTTVCKKNAIAMDLNSEGFCHPVMINPDACTNCGLCMKVCSFLSDGLAVINPPQQAYGAFSRNMNVRKKSSSGGVVYELAALALENGYKVCQVRYNVQNNRAEHYLSDDVEQLISGLGSKYIQSDTSKAFKKINIKDKNVVVGTPCQIDSFRRYIKLFNREDNFLLIDFFCHGVPSYLLWKKYVNMLEAKLGKLSYVSWRNKTTGWHDSWAIAAETDSPKEILTQPIRENNARVNSKWSKGDVFYDMFLMHHCLCEACHKHCKYKKMNSSADIRVGDFWGNTYADDDEGVSSVICFTQKGVDFVKASNLDLTSYKPEIVAEGQMMCNAKPSAFRSIFMKLLKSPAITIPEIKLVLNIYKMVLLPNRIINRIRRML